MKKNTLKKAVIALLTACTLSTALCGYSFANTNNSNIDIPTIEPVQFETVVENVYSGTIYTTEQIDNDLSILENRNGYH